VDRQIPTVDLSGFGTENAPPAEFLSQLRVAAHEVGFFYLTGHGVDPELLREIALRARHFFVLPESDKLAIDMVNSPHFRGYTRAGSECTRGGVDWREQIDIGAERAALPREVGAPAWTRLQGPNQWPAALPELRPVVLRWQRAAAGVLIRLLHALALALGQQRSAFEPLHGSEPHHLTKLIRYPGREAIGREQGVGPHKDAGLLTLLLQDSVGGLQVEVSDAWIDVPPRAGALVVNIGELLEMASDGYLRATLHRVVAPPAGSERISVAFFLGARLEAEVDVLQLPPILAAQSRGPERDPANPLLRNVGDNHLKGRLRSHPDVARRHHADLLGTSELGSPAVPTGYP